MTTIWPGLAQIVLGIVFCFFGYPAARFVLALWGAVLGFFLGIAGYAAIAGAFGYGVGAVAPWVAGAVGAVLLAWLAFAFYSVAVLLSMGSIGWGLGQLLASAWHLPVWLSVTAGVVVALALVIIGLTLDLPRLLLTLVTALAGAGGVVDGVRTLLGQPGSWYDSIAAGFAWGPALVWPAAFLGLAIVGFVFQSRQHSGKTLRSAYRK